MENKNESRFYFLLEIGKNIDHQSERMKKAFDFVNHKNYRAEWIDFDYLKIKNLSTKDPSYRIVIENFDDSNSSFEYLRHKELRIISPIVIFYCFRNICLQPFCDLPLRPYPIFSQCMRGLEVTSSHLSPIKQRQIKNKIEMMSGKYCNNLHTTTSFLVTDSMLSQKTRSAIENNIPIMNIEWIESCWLKYQYEYRRAGEMDIVSKYQVLIFHKLNIVVSGQSMKEREEIKNLVETNGGHYNPSLIMKPIQKNTILLLNSPNGEKYKHAKTMNIPCLQTKWIYDSLETGHILPFDQYYIDTESESSENDVHENVYNPDEDDNYEEMNDENETQLNQVEDEVDVENDDVEEYECDHNMCSLIQGGNEEQNLEMNAPIPTIMFSGFEREEKLRLSKLCNEKIPEIIIKDDSIVTSELTHLILVEPCGTEKVYAAIVAGAFILKPNYIEDSIKTNTLLNEKEYQWGNGIDDEKIGTCCPKLMKSAIKWNNHLKQIKQSMFHGHKFLLLFDVTKFNCKMLMSCANILRAGGAEIIHPDEFNNVEKEELLELLHHIDYAIIQWREGQNFTINHKSLFDYIEYFEQNERLITDTIIYKYIMEGPDVTLVDLIAKYPTNIH